MSKKRNFNVVNDEEVTDEVMEGEVIDEEDISLDELDELCKKTDAMAAKLEMIKKSKKRRTRNILIGAGIGVAGILGGMYIMGKKAEKEREEAEANAGAGDSNLVLYSPTGDPINNDAGMFTADGPVNTF
jgi:hypothetical protein